MEKQFIETENVIEPAATRQDDLTAEERASWLQSIERDLREIAKGCPQQCISHKQFWQELTEAVSNLSGSRTSGRPLVAAQTVSSPCEDLSDWKKETDCHFPY